MNRNKDNNDINILIEYKNLWAVKYGIVIFSSILLIILYLTFTTRITEIIKISDVQLVTKTPISFKGNVGSNESRGIQIGQEVTIYIDESDSSKLGSLNGFVSALNKNDKEKSNTIRINLNNRMVSDKEYEIPDILNLKGTGEIILKDRRLIDMVFNDIKKMINNGD